VTVKLANARKVRLIAESWLKTDKVDPKSLAQLERAGFLREAYISPRPIRDNRYIRWALTESACLAPSKDYVLGSFHRRLKARRGNLKARVAVARKRLAAVWHVLTYGEPYRLASFPAI